MSGSTKESRAYSILELLRTYVYDMHNVSDSWIRNRSLYTDIIEIVEEDRESGGAERN